MRAKKFSESTGGRWLSAADGTPVLELKPSALPASSPAIAHALGTGLLRASVNLLGQLVIADVSRPDDDQTDTFATANLDSAFSVRVACQGRQRTFLLSNVSPAEKPLVEWGVCHARYAAEIELAGRRIGLSLTFAAPVRADYLIAELVVDNPDDRPLPVDLLVVAEPPWTTSDEEPPTAFKRQTVAMFTNASPQGKDFFLAAHPDWALTAEPRSLHASATRVVAAKDRLTGLFLIGLRQDCGLRWAEEQLKSASVNGARTDWAKMLDLTFPRFPETWMKEECMWDVSRLLCGRRGARLPEGDDETADRERAIVRGGGSPAAADGDSLGNMLRLSLPLAYVNPELARNNLVFVTANLRPSGRLGGASDDDFRPERDRCDLEIWFILAWCTFIQLTGDLAAGHALAAGMDGKSTLSDCLARAYSWIETAIGTGAHGLLRAGAGDGFALLDAFGRHGCGESFTATAQLVYALELWLALDAQLAERPPLAMQKARLWLPALRDALGQAFVEGAFLRGFDDRGAAFGCNRPDDRWFLDAQAWGLLSGCGTAEQRHAVLALLEDAADDDALPVISTPYEPPPPPSVCARVDLPGCGLNGGIDSFVWACAVWAMADAGARDAALAQWRQLTLRKLMAEHDMPPFRPAKAAGTLPSRHLRAGRRTACHAGAPDNPDDAWLSWQHFALCKLMT